jgi:hypothetical protein
MSFRAEDAHTIRVRAKVCCAIADLESDSQVRASLLEEALQYRARAAELDSQSRSRDQGVRGVRFAIIEGGLTG